ncbi:sterile alpha motif domain-containing protein 3-like [Ixodes scapularis]
MSVTCLLTVGTNGARRKLTLEEANLRGIKASASTCSLLASEINFESDRFQVLDKDFNEYVDILDEDKIHDMALLRVVKTAHGGETPSGEGSSVDENTPGTSQERHFKITPSHGDDDGAGFVLPDFDFLKAAAAGGKPLGSYVTTRIVDVLFQEMATHTLQKFKNERRKLSTDRVMSSREKYGSTAKKPRTSSGTTTEELQRGSIGQTLAQSSTPCGEDASSLAQHEAWLCQEWKKPNPDNQQMRCRLELTHQARVEQLSRLSVAVAVTKYPYLRDADLFFHDFNMLLKKDGAAAVVEGMQIVLSLALGDRLGAKRKDTMPVLEADKATACARRKKRMFIKTC